LAALLAAALLSFAVSFFSTIAPWSHVDAPQPQSPGVALLRVK
jgi:hypothetical protein